jgi:beta-lactam-binding protein with PASTA domain
VKFRRHLPPSTYWRSLLRKDSPEFQQHARELRLSLRHLAIFLGAVLLGYLLAALLLFRAPIFAQTSSVPRVIGLSADSAKALLQKSGLAAKTGDHVSHPSIAQGRVVWQDPPPEVLATAGTTVDLAISDGPQRVLVPDVAGYDEDTARLLMESAGLTVTIERAQTAAPRGVVVNSRPPSGTALNPGRPVALVVSQGAPTITVPDVAGLTLQDARVKIEAAGLRVGTTLTRSTTVAEPGNIIEQRPQAGTLGAPGTAVDLVIARQPQ